ncbi:MAG: ribosome small subunit-dependent GTPase A [Thermostichus sp. HHBFW_bins_43]
MSLKESDQPGEEVAQEGSGSPLCLGWVRAAQANFYRVRMDPALAAVFPGIQAHLPAQKPTPAELLCTRRAKLRKTGQQVMVGDWVEVGLPPTASDLWPERGVIESILPRRTQLHRPAIANLSQALVVVALAEPDPEPTLISRFLVQAEASQLRVQVVLNKADCVDPGLAETWMDRLRSWGYTPLLVSAHTQAGIPAVRQCCRDQISVVMGPSGVGKSSLLNRLLPDAQLATQAVSGRLRHGRHTTRHVELFPLPEGGWIADSPGFNANEGIPSVHPLQLIQGFPEVRNRLGNCQFRDCLHDQEPGCGVREPDWERRSFYLQLLREAQAAQPLGFVNARPEPDRTTSRDGIRQIPSRHRRVSRRQNRQALQNPKLGHLGSEI